MRESGVTMRMMKQSRRLHRNGFLLTETVVALGMMGVLFLMIIPLITSVRGASREMERRERALDFASNIIEEITARHQTATVTEDWLDQLKLPENAEELLPAAELKVRTAPDGDLQIVRVELSWENNQHTRPLPVKLSIWLTSNATADKPK